MAMQFKAMMTGHSSLCALQAPAWCSFAWMTRGSCWMHQYHCQKAYLSEWQIPTEVNLHNTQRSEYSLYPVLPPQVCHCLRTQGTQSVPSLQKAASSPELLHSSFQLLLSALSILLGSLHLVVCSLHSLLRKLDLIQRRPGIPLLLRGLLLKVPASSSTR